MKCSFFSFLLLLISFGISSISIAANERSLTIGCDNIQRPACLHKFKKRIFLAKKFQENYDPRLKRMLFIAATSARIIKDVEKLQDPKYSKRFSIALQKEIFNTEMRFASVNTEELGNYTLQVIDKVIAGALDTTVAEVATLGILKASYDVVKTMVTEFPSIPISTLETAQQKQKERADAFHLLNEFFDEDYFKDASLDIEQTLGGPIATFLGITREITDAQLNADPNSVQIDAVSELLIYTEKGLVVELDQLQDAVNKNLKDEALKTKQMILRSYNDLMIKARELKNGQDGQENAAKDIRNDTDYLIEGVDYLAQRELESEEAQKVQNMKYEDLKKYNNQTAQLRENNGCSRLKANSIEAKNCFVRVKTEKGSRSVEEQRRNALRRNIAYQGVNIIGDLGVIFKDKNLQSIANDAGKLLKGLEAAQKAIEAFEKIEKAQGLLTNMSNLMTGIGAVTSVISLFMSSGPSMEELIMKELAAIKKAIAELHESMLKEFNKVAMHLESIHHSLTNSINEQTKFLSKNQAIMASNHALTSEKIFTNLKDLNIINQNIDKLFQREMHTELMTAAERYRSSLDPALVETSFRDILSLYKAQIAIIDPSGSSAHRHEFAINYKALSSSSRLINTFSNQKTSSYGRSILLSSLIGLDSQLGPECSTELLTSIVFANTISKEFLRGLEARVLGISQRDQKINSVLAGNLTDKNALYEQISETYDILSRLQTKAKQCLVTEDDSANIIDILFSHYFNQLEQHTNYVNNFVTQNKGLLYTQMESLLKQVQNEKYASDTLFNGQSGENREDLKITIATNFDNLEQLQDDKETSKIFIRETKKWIKMELCSPSNTASRVKELSFPSVTMDNLIKDNNLKHALYSGLIKWKFCFEIGPFNKKTGNKKVLIQAKETNFNSTNGESKRVVATWELEVRIPKNKHKQAERKWKKTVYPSCTFLPHTENHCIENKKRNSQVTFVDTCTEVKATPVRKKSCSRRPRNAPYFDAIDVRGTDIENPQGNYCTYEYSSYTTCKFLKEVTSEQWENVAVNSNKAYLETKKRAIDCFSVEHGMLSTCLSKKPSLEGFEKYDEKAQSYLRKNFHPWAKHFEMRLWHNKESNKDKKSKKIELKQGIERYYLILRSMYESCYFTFFKGEQACNLGGYSMILPTPEVDFNEISLAANFLTQIPFSFYTPQLKGIENQQKIDDLDIKLLEFLAEMPTPKAFYSSMENIYYSGELNLTVPEISQTFLEEKRKLYEDKILPLIRENYKLDDSLFIDPEVFESLINLKASIKAKL